MSDNRLTELLADHATFGLDSADEKELYELFESTADPDLDSFELAAAVVDLSMFKPEQIPDTLERKLIRQGRAAIATESGSSMDYETDSGPFDQGLQTEVPHRETNRSSPKQKEVQKNTSHPSDHNSSAQDVTQTQFSSNRIREIIAWGCAAAIGFVALMVWTNNRDTVKDLEQKLAQLQNDNSVLTVETDFLGKQKVVLERSNEDLKNERNSLEFVNSELRKQVNPDGRELYNELVQLDEAIRWTWSPTEDAKTSAKGEVVWDGDSQKGVMRLVDLEQNNPLTSQYQLWIIEENGRENPVDGGVFDVESDGEIYIPIDAKLFASKPAFFAITREKPNGVVKSARKDLPLIAKAPAAQD